MSPHEGLSAGGKLPPWQWPSDVSGYQDSLAGPVKSQTAGSHLPPTPELLRQQVWGGVADSAFLISSQVLLLLLLVQGPDLESRCSRAVVP